MDDRKSIYIPQTVSVPVPLYKSMQGRYYVGYADNLDYTGVDISAWASLYNPWGSGVNLHVNVWTATDLYSVFRAQIWFNADMPGDPFVSELVTTSNYTIHPTPQPKVKLLYVPRTAGVPQGGVKAFVRRGQPEETMVAEENGRFIFPPGDSFSVFLSNPETPVQRSSGRIAFGWYEEPIRYQ